MDNTAVLGGVVKGTSGQPVLEKLVADFWVLCYRFQIRVWLEHIDSDANWRDGISRDTDADGFAPAHEFLTCEAEFDSSWLARSYSELWHDPRRFELHVDGRA